MSSTKITTTVGTIIQDCAVTEFPLSRLSSHLTQLAADESWRHEEIHEVHLEALKRLQGIAY